MVRLTKIQADPIIKFGVLIFIKAANNFDKINVKKI